MRHLGQNHTRTMWYIWRLKTKFLRLQVENKYDAHRVRNFIVLPIFMFSIIFTWNSTPFWPKKLFSTSKTGRVILFPLYLCTQHPHIFFWNSETLCWLVKLHLKKISISFPGETAVACKLAKIARRIPLLWIIKSARQLTYSDTSIGSVNPLWATGW